MQDKDRLLKIANVFLIVLVVGSSFLLYASFEKIKQQNDSISALQDLSMAQKEIISGLLKNNSDLSQNLSVNERILRNETLTRQKLEDEIMNLTRVNKRDYGILAVDDNDVGHLVPLEVILKEGKGNLFINVAKVRYDETLQSSAQTAIHVARDVSKTSLANKDIFINIKSPSEVEDLIISGGSAGGAIALAAIALMEGRTLRSDVLITGTIREDHTIGKISAARAKALAAKDNGATIFLVPEEQKSDVGDIGIDVEEVKTIEDAVRYAIS